jgi:RNA polymerase sigma-70 factor (ECF subfamily)
MASNVEHLVREGTSRLVARAADARGAEPDRIAARVRASLDKYLLRHSPEARAEEVESFIDSMHADELLLVLACERGDEQAWNDLMEQYRATVLSAARGASAGEAEAEELAQSVWAELYGLRVREGGERAGKLAYYSGCGSLGGWLRAVVGQLAVDRHRRTSRLVQTEEASDFDRAAGDAEHHDGWRAERALDPESELAEAESSRAVEAALGRAVAELSDEDRLLVRLYYLDGLRLKEAGAVLGVHEATASRRLARVHAELRRRVEAVLIKEQRWSREETERAFSELAGARSDTDLRSMLAAGTRGGEQREELYE